MPAPSKPTGDFALRTQIYAEDGIYSKMTDSEMLNGRNNTGEVETPLGSMPNALKENWLFSYFNQHIVYLEDAVDYILQALNDNNIEPSS